MSFVSRVNSFFIEFSFISYVLIEITIQLLKKPSNLEHI
jgi:hypothetical protein